MERLEEFGAALTPNWPDTSCRARSCQARQGNGMQCVQFDAEGSTHGQLPAKQRHLVQLVWDLHGEKPVSSLPVCFDGICTVHPVLSQGKTICCSHTVICCTGDEQDMIVQDMWTKKRCWGVGRAASRNPPLAAHLYCAP